jgi:hypothetical protein
MVCVIEMKKKYPRAGSFCRASPGLRFSRWPLHGLPRTAPLSLSLYVCVAHGLHHLGREGSFHGRWGESVRPNTKTLSLPGTAFFRLCFCMMERPARFAFLLVRIALPAPFFFSRHSEQQDRFGSDHVGQTKINGRGLRLWLGWLDWTPPFCFFPSSVHHGTWHNAGAQQQQPAQQQQHVFFFLSSRQRKIPNPRRNDKVPFLTSGTTNPGRLRLSTLVPHLPLFLLYASISRTNKWKCMETRNGRTD